MGFGIGGGLGPLRMGVGTRGVGVGLGPLHASSGWGGRSRRRGQEGAGAVFGFLLVVTLALIWPYLLGTWLAVEAGADNPSTARTTVGWTFESIYIVLILAGIVGHFAGQRAQRKAAEEARQRAMQNDWAHGLETIEQFAGRTTRRPSGSQMPASVSARKNEVLLDGFRDVSLVQPRVAARGNPPRPSVVDHGQLLVTNNRILFLGEHKNVTWELKQVTTMRAQPDMHYLAVATGNRQTISGISTDTAADFVRARMATAWALSEWHGDQRHFDNVLGAARHELQCALG